MDNKIRKNSIIYAFRRSVGIIPGFLPVGIAYGIMMSEAGYGCLWTALASIFVYAGSLQMLAVSFLTSHVPIVTVAITALLLNSRHIFYGISFIDRFKKFGLWRYYVIFGLTDENYSLLCSNELTDDLDDKTVAVTTTVLLQIYWVTFSTLGGAIGYMITFDLRGIDFALTALFTVILIDMIKKSESKLPFAIAIISALLCLIIFGAQSFLLPSLLVDSCILCVLKKQIEKGGEC